MALSDIIQKITDEAKKKTAFMKQVADDEIKKINEEAVKKAEAKKLEVQESAKKKCESVIEKAKILAKMENNSSLLKEKREVIDSVYNAVEEELNSLSDHDYVQLIVKMMKHASEVMEKGELVVPSDRRKQTEEAIEKANAEFHIKEESNKFKGGFVVRSAKAEVNLSFSYLLNRIIRPKTELELAKVLFK